MKVLKQAACVQLAPTLRSAILLECLWWSHRHSKIVIDGQRWCALTFEQFVARTMLTQTQVKRGMSDLVKAKLVVRKKRSLQHRVHTALPDRTVKTLEKICEGAPPGESKSAPPGETTVGLPGETPVVPPSIYDELDTENSYEELDAAAVPAAGELSEEKTLSKKTKEEKMKVADVVAEHEQNVAEMSDPELLAALVKGAGSTHGPEYRKYLVAIWRGAWKISEIPGPIRAIGSKEKGQFNQLGNWLHDEPDAEGIRLEALLAHVVSRWSVFRAHIAQETGFNVKNVSQKPDVGVLLYRKELAVGFMLADLAHAHAPNLKPKIADDFLG